MSIFPRVLTRLLSPLVRYLIGQNWTYPALCELLKKIYIANAEQHCQQADGKPGTDSRISLLTGIHRKDVKRLRDELAQEHTTPLLRKSAGLAVRTVSAWVSRYSNEAGAPQPLPFREDQGDPSFEGLIRELKADMRAKSILDELARTGVAQLDEHGLVHLLRTAYISDLPEDKLAFLGDNVGDHLSCALDNISHTDTPPFMERAVFFNSVPAEGLDAIKAGLNLEADKLLRETHSKIIRVKTTELDTDVIKTKRVRFGVYYYEEDNNES